MSGRLKAGDRISCRIKAGSIVSPYDNDYNNVFIFEILAKDEHGYCVHVPHYVHINSCIILTRNRVIDWGINNKFLNEKCVYVKESFVGKIEYVMDGCLCIKCEEFYDRATPNQENGTMICWNCRNYPFFR